MAVDRRIAGRQRSRMVQRKRRTPPGAPPGTLVADPAAVAPRVRLMAYGPDSLEERDVSGVEDLKSSVGERPVTWINVDGLADLDLIRRLGEMFGVHSLALEDVVNVHQRPKVEEYEDHAFIVTRMIHAEETPATEQITMFLGANFLLTFQERPGDCFDLVRDRLRGRRGTIRERTADYLAYALLDAVIDGYFPILEVCGEELERLEDSVMRQPSDTQIGEIYDMKRDLLALRRVVWPLREMVNALTRDSPSYVSDRTRPYLRDCYDHTIQLMDMIETYREIASGLVDIYLSRVSARMNGVMKVLTIIATLFMPLGFIAGLYGMNFNANASPWNMPELSWYWGYPFALSLMATIAASLLVLFWRKGWLGGGDGGGRRDRRPPA